MRNHLVIVSYHRHRRMMKYFWHWRLNCYTTLLSKWSSSPDHTKSSYCESTCRTSPSRYKTASLHSSPSSYKSTIKPQLVTFTLQVSKPPLLTPYYKSASLTFRLQVSKPPLLTFRLQVSKPPLLTPQPQVSKLPHHTQVSTTQQFMSMVWV